MASSRRLKLVYQTVGGDVGMDGSAAFDSGVPSRRGGVMTCLSYIERV
jgi:hypothetical protein